MKTHTYLVKFRDGEKVYVIERTLARAKFVAKACRFFAYRINLPQIRSARRLAPKEEWDKSITTVGIDGRSWETTIGHVIYTIELAISVPRKLQ